MVKIFTKRRGRWLRLPLLLLLLVCPLIASAGTKVPYGIFNESDKSFTLMYGESPTDDMYTIVTNSGGYNATNTWNSKTAGELNADNVLKVTLDPSFKDYRPKSINTWFNGFTKMTVIDGIENLVTDSVRTMAGVFAGCENLTSLDLGHFNTENVLSMYGMFSYCKSLKLLDVSSFNTEKVSDMTQMFGNMPSIEILDLSSFSMDNVSSAMGMFMQDTSLFAIIANDSWNDAHAGSNGRLGDVSNVFFLNCKHLVGGKGTTYDKEKVGDEYARIDGGVDNPGYLTSVDDVEYEPYAILDTKDSVFTLRYGYVGSQPAYRFVNNSVTNRNCWISDNDTIDGEKRFNMKKIVFESSFRKYMPTSLSRWFEDFSGITTIEGIENLRTDSVTDMSRMFYQCNSLQSLDVSHFNTSKVTNMRQLFNGLRELETLDVRNFDTRNVEDMQYMFAGCFKLKTLDISGFDMRSVTNMNSMFSNCRSLVSLDLRGINTPNVTHMSGVFAQCYKLTSLDLLSLDTRKAKSMFEMFLLDSALVTIAVGENWSTESLQSEDEGKDMFRGCVSLVGVMGTTYNADYVNEAYARIDGGEGRPGYFADVIKESKFALTYMLDDKVYQVDSIAAGGNITPAEVPDRMGIPFAGWSDLPATMPDSNVTVKGYNKYLLTYIVDGDTFHVDTATYGVKYILYTSKVEEPVKEGYTFLSWAGGGRLPATITSDLTLIAKFKVNTYVLTYMVDESVILVDTVAFGDTIKPADAPAKDGYVFEKWEALPEIMPATDLTVNAVYKQSTDVASQRNEEVRVWSSDKSIFVAVPESVPYRVYDVTGAVVAQGVAEKGETKIAMTHRSIYIVKLNELIFKVVLE